MSFEFQRAVKKCSSGLNSAHVAFGGTVLTDVLEGGWLAGKKKLKARAENAPGSSVNPEEQNVNLAESAMHLTENPQHSLDNMLADAGTVGEMK